MTVRKKISADDAHKLSDKISATKQAFVFISHDSRDAELAEEFGELLSLSSAGALRSFRSSDKKGTHGIPYGQEWYPAIMDKIDEASDVVCLLTQHSVDRPWILYEAGVAKGKLDKKVIGLVLGIQFSTAITGPFAQFQNNDGDADSISKLVLELVRKIPGLDPNPKLVKQLSENFVQKADEVNKKIQQNKVQPKDDIDENSTAKLFEEVKIMFDSLPAKIESRLDPESRRRRIKFRPVIIDEFMHLDFLYDDQFTPLLVFISFFKDDLPWFYEIGIETYRSLKNAKNGIEREKALQVFERASSLLRHPIVRESMADSKESYFLIREGSHTLQRLIDGFRADKKNKE